MNSKPPVLCVGEVLWDALPSGLFLGGAPLNVCFHLNQLGMNGKIASRVGEDRLGKEVLRRIEEMNMSVQLIQQDSIHETGFAEVALDTARDAEFTIIESVAWDNIHLTDYLEAKASEAWAIVYGTLAQRESRSRQTIHRLLQSDALKVLDVNLRSPYDDPSIVRDSLEFADILKLNSRELVRLTKWFDLPDNEREAMQTLAEVFDLELVAITRGNRGASMLRNNTFSDTENIAVDVVDTVGAGDAFTAALIAGFALDKEDEVLLDFANATGAFVASKAGAMPRYSREHIETLIT